MCDISVIMPVYNSEHYLKKAISSVLEQNFNNFELILINDGSQDKSGQICEEFAFLDSRVRVIHQNNSGICKSRNQGILLANGEYITFIDNDDEYMPNLLKDNFTLASTTNADVVKFGCTCLSIFDNYYTTVKKTYSENLLVRKDEKSKYYIPIKNTGIINFVWNGLYRKKFLIKNHIFFDENFKNGLDDQIFNLSVYSHIEQLVINPNIYYIWYRRYCHSTSYRFSYSKIEERFKVCLFEKKILFDLQINNPTYWYSRIGYHLTRSSSEIFTSRKTFTYKEVIYIFKTIKNTFLPLLDEIPKLFFKKYNKYFITLILYQLKMFSTLYILFSISNKPKHINIKNNKKDIKDV